MKRQQAKDRAKDVKFSIFNEMMRDKYKLDLRYSDTPYRLALSQKALLVKYRRPIDPNRK